MKKGRMLRFSARKPKAIGWEADVRACVILQKKEKQTCLVSENFRSAFLPE
jgi:hypothetical protein